MSHIKKKNKDVPVIIISGHANIEMAVKSLKSGAFEFIEKPFDQDRLMNFVNRAVENFNLKKENKEYETKLFSSYDLIGDSKNIKDILNPYYTTKKNGTGLGLSIVNKIVNDHNGNIRFLNIDNGARIEIIFSKK